ncbi:hypothetical protein Y1Q_0018016 [Alligator mississippiensis]|uniref:Uncharacterized protein n=1 Tax=Alligator mississippiensis TaxID=8496 RepID=A0A151MXV4_ALLMI|nr:hypothetical protein Y1Q_0018016 [Alligator mississippiensis]
MQGYNRDRVQCHSKTKVMRSLYHYVLEANKQSRTQRQIMSFYEELSNFLTKDRATNSPHTYETTRGLEDDRTAGCPGVQGPQGSTTAAGTGPGESGALLLVPTSSQDAYLLLEVCWQDIFSPMAESMEHGTQEEKKSSNVMDFGAQDLQSRHMPSISWEPPLPWTLTLETIAKLMGPGTLFPRLGPWIPDPLL